jgi:hypothetical protein
MRLAAGRAQVYVWGRRHPYVSLSFLGIFNFSAPYLPWVLLAFSVTLRSNAAVDLLGILAGAQAWDRQVLQPLGLHTTPAVTVGTKRRQCFYVRACKKS